MQLIGADGLVDVRDTRDGLGVQNSCDDDVNYPRVVKAKETVGSVEKPRPVGGVAAALNIIP